MLQVLSARIELLQFEKYVQTKKSQISLLVKEPSYKVLYEYLHAGLFS